MPMHLLAIAHVAILMRCNPLTEYGYRDWSDYVRLQAAILRNRV